MTYEDVIQELYSLQDQEKVHFKRKKFGVVANNSLGIYHADLKVLAKSIGRDNALAIKLFDSGIYEGRLLCSKVFSPKELTEELAEKWVKTFENWEICDSFCMGIIAKSDLALAKILDWSEREAEFEKRASFATMAAYCMADKKSGNELFEQFLPILIGACKDERLYVKKAVNWALRSIGKRNVDLRTKAVECAKRMLEFEDSAATWIAKDALRELTKEGVRMSDYPRSIYRA